MIVCCPKCGSPMTQKSRITFAMGPAKLVYGCTRNANHVTVHQEDPALEADDPPTPEPAGQTST